TASQRTCRHLFHTAPQIKSSPVLIDSDFNQPFPICHEVGLDFQLARAKAATLSASPRFSPFSSTHVTGVQAAASGKLVRQGVAQSVAKIQTKLKTSPIDPTGGSHVPAVWSHRSRHLSDARRGIWPGDTVIERR